MTGIDPTIQLHAEEMARLAFDESVSAADVDKLAVAFQRAFEDWADDIEASRPTAQGDGAGC